LVNVKAKRGVVLSTGGFEYNCPCAGPSSRDPASRLVLLRLPGQHRRRIEIAIKGRRLAKVAKSASRIEIAVPYGRGMTSRA
jgi:hypothetical protein